MSPVGCLVSYKVAPRFRRLLGYLVILCRTSTGFRRTICLLGVFRVLVELFAFHFFRILILFKRVSFICASSVIPMSFLPLSFSIHLLLRFVLFESGLFDLILSISAVS